MMGQEVSLIDGHIESYNLELEGLFSVCEELKNTSSRTTKEEILHRNIIYDDFKSLLLFLFDSSVTTGLDIKKIHKSIFVDYPINNIDNFISLLNYVEVNNTGKDADILNVRNAIVNITSDNEEHITFLEEVVTKSLRLGIDAKTVNKVFGYEFIPTFDVQLGTSIEEVKLKGDEEIFISQKLNGTRCIYWKGELWTRSGKKYTGCQHIIKDIEILCREELLIHPYEFVFDGELVLKNCDLSDSEAFQKGTGIANSKNETKEELEYVIFDVLSRNEFESKTSISTYKDRRSYLEGYPEIFSRLELKNIRIVPFFYAGYDHSKIWEYLNIAESQDMEGIIVNLDTPYEFKRTKNLIKVKKFWDTDLKCIGIEQGEKGKYKNTLGSIVCKYKDWEVKVGSGFTEDLRDYYFNNPDEIIGKIVSVKYKEATKNKNGTESLQFPVFLAVREDKDQADW